MMRRLLVMLSLLTVGAAFAQAEPATVRGISSQPGLTESEALQSARDDAIEALLPRLRETVTIALKQQSRPISAPGDETLRQIIAADLAANSSMILDKATERRERPYGVVWNAGVLVDASQKSLERMTRKALDVARATRKRDVQAGVGIAALLGLVGLGYFTANAVTRGYYIWRLRMICLATTIAGLAVVSAAYYGNAFHAIGG